jgi:hypothetical protein
MDGRKAHTYAHIEVDRRIHTHTDRRIHTHTYVCAYIRTHMYAETHVCADVTEAHASATL